MAGLVVGRTLKPERMAGPGVILVVDDQHIVSEMAQENVGDLMEKGEEDLVQSSPSA